MTRPPAIFEVDDYPRGWQECIGRLDQFRELNDTFCATVFAIPGMMTEETWAPLTERAEWIHVGMHGFEHTKAECRGHSPIINRGLVKGLFDRRFCKLFKAPHYGYSVEMTKALKDLQWTIFIQRDAEMFNIPRRWQNWIKVLEFDIGINVCYLSRPGRKTFHRHTGRAGPTDILGRQSRYRRWVKQYDFHFSEDDAVWV